MSQEFVPYGDIEKMGKAVAGSGLFGVKTEQQAIALMLIAQAYGKHPAVAAMEYNIINNRPSKKSEAMLASFQEAGGKVKWLELTYKKAKAEFSHPSGGTLELEWTIEMAQQAGLIEKEYSNYKKYPRAMLRSRVVAEGVRAVYPAATSGMLSKEEAEDIVEPDNTKSRVENIIDAQIEVKTEAKDAPKEEVKETTKNKSKAAEVANDKPNAEVKQTGTPTVGEGNKLAQGIITAPPTYAEIGAEKKPKWVFKMVSGDKELKLGTFDKAVFEGICAICDLQKGTPILLNIEYKERPSGEKTVRDIIKFSQVTTS